MPQPPTVDRQQCSVVRRVTLCALAIAVAISGCGLSDPAEGVSAIASQQSAGDPPIVVALPPVAGAGDAGSAVETGDVEDTDSVDTLVEPLVDRPSTIAVVGDSLTLSAQEEISDALTGAGLEVLAVDGVESRRIVQGTSRLTPGTDAVEQILSEATVEPGIWVIALGTNDVASTGSLDGFRADIRQILSLIPPDAPVIWVDLWIRGRQEPVSRANLQIRAELRKWSGGSAVVDWYSHGEDEGIITSDGVHLTPSGQELFAESIVIAVDELFAPAG